MAQCHFSNVAIATFATSMEFQLVISLKLLLLGNRPRSSYIALPFLTGTFVCTMHGWQQRQSYQV